MKAILRYKGGPGSGNFGHSGRPGEVGGSGGGATGSARFEGAKIRSAIAKTGGKKDVGFVNNEGGKIVVRTPYNEGFVADLKNNIPYSMRKWEGGVWNVDPKYEEQATDITKKYFLTEIGLSKAARVEARNTVKRYNVIGLQKGINGKRSTFDNAIQKLTATIESYGYSSRSSNKADAIRVKALFEHALDNASWKVDKIVSGDDILTNGMRAALREIGDYE